MKPIYFIPAFLAVFAAGYFAGFMLQKRRLQPEARAQVVSAAPDTSAPALEGEGRQFPSGDGMKWLRLQVANQQLGVEVLASAEVLRALDRLSVAEAKELLDIFVRDTQNLAGGQERILSELEGFGALLYERFAEKNPEEALAHLLKAFPEGRELDDEFAAGVISGWVKRDPAAAEKALADARKNVEKAAVSLVKLRKEASETVKKAEAARLDAEQRAAATAKEMESAKARLEQVQLDFESRWRPAASPSTSSAAVASKS